MPPYRPLCMTHIRMLSGEMLNYSYTSSPGAGSSRAMLGRLGNHSISPEMSKHRRTSMAAADKSSVAGSARSPDRLNWSRLSVASSIRGDQNASSVYPANQQQTYSPIAKASESHPTMSIPTHRRKISNSLSLLSLSRLSARNQSLQQADENAAFDTSLNESNISKHSATGSAYSPPRHSIPEMISRNTGRLFNSSPQKLDASVIEESKRREHEQTLLAYVTQLKSDLEHERQLVKDLLAQERAYKDQEALLRDELAMEKARCRLFAERLLRSRQQVEVQSRDLARALNDLEGWRRLAEKTTFRQQELEFECEQQASMLVEQASFFTQKSVPKTRRRGFPKGKLAVQAQGILERVMSFRKGFGGSRGFKGDSRAFATVQQDLERLRIENTNMRRELVRMAKERQEEDLRTDLDLAVEQLLGKEELGSSLVRSFMNEESRTSLKMA